MERSGRTEDRSGCAEERSGRARSRPPAVAARHDVTAACVGNVVEWYDFAIFGALATVLGPVFFRTEHPSTSLLAAFAVYGTAFVMRPAGALLIGRQGDLSGRRTVLVVSIALMTVATAAVGLLPGYAVIGVMAPVSLVLLRAAQGLAAGGELGVAAVFIVETAPHGRRGGYAAWHTVTMSAGIALGLGVGALLGRLVADEQLADGWWRAAFLVALPLGLVGVYLRRRVRETAQFSRLIASRLTDAPLTTVWNQHRPALLAGFAVVAAGSLGFNTFFIFLPNHLVATSELRLSVALALGVLGLLVAAGAAVVCGRVSDRLGRRPVVLASAALLGVLAIPLVHAANTGSELGLAASSVLGGAAVGGVLPIAMLVEMFPPELRATGLSLSAGLATALIGGTAPLFEQVVVHATDVQLAPGVYVAAISLIALVVVWRCPETAFRPFD